MELAQVDVGLMRECVPQVATCMYLAYASAVWPAIRGSGAPGDVPTLPAIGLRGWCGSAIRGSCCSCGFGIMHFFHLQDAFVVRYAWRMVHPWLMPQLWVTMLLLPLPLPPWLGACVVLWLLVCTLGASENERTRISEPHGNTHLRPSHNDPH